MKTTSVVVLALLSASALAQPIVVLKGTTTLNTRDIAPSELTDLEARKIHINWHKVGNFFKSAAKVVSKVLFKRDEDGNLYIVARDLTDDDGELLARDFDDDFLEARDIEDYLETRGFEDDDLEARDFDDEYLEVRDFDDESLEARDFDLEERSLLGTAGRVGRHLFHHADQYHQAASYIPRPHRQNNNNQRRDLEAESLLEARDLDLEERSLLGTAGRIGSHVFRHADQYHQAASYIPRPQRQNNNRQRRVLESENSLEARDLDLEERSLFGIAARVGSRIFHHAHHAHHAASYIPQGQNNQRRDLEDSLYDLD